MAASNRNLSANKRTQ